MVKLAKCSFLFDLQRCKRLISAKMCCGVQLLFIHVRLKVLPPHVTKDVCLAFRSAHFIRWIKSGSKPLLALKHAYLEAPS